MQHIHILGICGTFMGSLAQLAKQQGLRVTGCDQNVYPPMSTQLEQAGIELIQGFDPEQIKLKPDLFVVGNAISRGNPLMEEILDRGLSYCSGPQWLSDNVLKDKWVLGVAGTHGKTTTSSMLAWILEYAGFEPGYLIGGVPNNFESSARLGQSDFFVIEADEYDSAFFDKRSKFIHYGSRTLILNNLEFDHADIFRDLEAIKSQFNHLLRTVPRTGMVLYPEHSDNLNDVIQRGCWAETQTLGSDWQATNISAGAGEFDVSFSGHFLGQVTWQQTGQHNVENALAALAAARHIGVDMAVAIQALSEFKGVKRRMEVLAKRGHVTVYDDFAHHPTAIATTLQGLRDKSPNDRILAVIEPRSNTMRMGVHQGALVPACSSADACFWYEPANSSWSLEGTLEGQSGHRLFHELESLKQACIEYSQLQSSNLHIVIMSNGGFGGFHQLLIKGL